MSEESFDVHGGWNDATGDQGKYSLHLFFCQLYESSADPHGNLFSSAFHGNWIQPTS
jgi:hypothetical protein